MICVRGDARRRSTRQPLLLPVCAVALLLFLPAPLFAVSRTWSNTGTDFNTGANWGGTVPGSSDVAVFSSAATKQPNLSASLSIQALNFSASGYDLTSSSTSIKLTLTNTGTGSSSAINASNTSGTTTIDAPIVLGASSGSTQTFTQASGGTLIVNGVISNTNSVTLSLTGGIITLAGANTYSGGTTLAGSTTLRINNATALGTGTFTINGGTIDNTTGSSITLTNNNAQTWNADFTFTGTQNLNMGTGAISLGTTAGTVRTITVNADTLTEGGIISNGSTANSLTKAGSGTLTLTGANSYTGSTTVSAGILNIQNSGALGTTASGTTVSSGATLQLQNGISVGSEALTISGSGASGQNGALVNVSGTNNYAGLITLGAASTISSDSGTLNITNAGTITGSGFGLTLTGSGTGALSSIVGTGAGNLTKSGSGTWTLSGANTYTGATTVNAGTLFVNGSLASGSAVTVNNSGTVLGGTGTINGSVSIASSGAILEAGTGSTGQTLTMKGAVTMASGSIIEIALGAALAHSTLAIGAGGSISFQALQKFNIINLGVTSGSAYTGIITGIGSDPGTENGWTITNQTWTYLFSYDALNGGEINLTVSALTVPEPTTWSTGALAVLALIYNQRRRLIALVYPS
jgi:fibronectin-binding autotransporter adhesin